MEQNQTFDEVVKELQATNSNEAELREVIEKWFTATRATGMKLGAYMISAAVYETMRKHLKKGKDASLRDYKRMTDDIVKIVTVQLAQQNDSTTETETNEQEGSI